MRPGLCVSLIGIAVSLMLLSHSPVMPQERLVRAKIGIQISSRDQLRRAKSQDTLQVGDLLRIYVHPEEPSQVLVVYSDTKTATLLHLTRQQNQSASLVLPSLDEFYRMDGENPVQTFTIICSSTPLTEVLEVLRTGKAPAATWSVVEARLLEKSRIELSQQTAKPFAIAGNVRGVGGVSNLDPFVEQLQIFSGKTLLVKQYAFQVQK